MHSTDPVIGRYKLLLELGRGGMGVVYLAEDTVLRRRVAIKVLHEEEAAWALARVRFLREARAMARLDHPGIVRVLDVGEDERRAYLVMELVEGRSLRALLLRGPVELGLALAIVARVARALHFAHERGVVHRDVKPENILIAYDGRVLLADFGLAKDARDDEDHPLTLPGEILGTPTYQSPEQALGQVSQAGFATDIYTLGVVLHELVGGEPSQIPAEVARICETATAAAPEARYPSAAAMAEALEQAIDALATTPAPPARGALAWLRARLPPRLARPLLIAGVVCVVAVLFAWYVSAAKAERREEEAAARLAAMWRNAERSLAEGDTAEAERLFRLYAAWPEHQDTRALFDAWYDWSKRAAARGDLDEQRAALAQAYASTADARLQGQALQALAELFVRDEDWASLERALDELRRRGVPPERTDRLHARLALAQRDLGAAIRLGPGSPLASTLDALRQHTPIGASGTRAWPLPGEPARVLVGDSQTFQVVTLEPVPRPGPPLRLPAELGQAPFVQLLAPPDAPPTLLTLHPSSASGWQQCAWRVSELALDRLFCGPDIFVQSAANADVDGDGREESYVGTMTSGLHLLEIPTPHLAPWAPRVAHGETALVESGVQAMTAADLDGDGRDEILAAAGPWRAYDLRVLRQSERVRGADRLELVARVKPGFVASIAALEDPRRPGTRRVVAVKRDEAPSARMFPPDQLMGWPAGLYLFDLKDGRLDGARLDIDEHAPRGDLRGVGVGDLDGDGVEDLFAVGSTLKGDAVTVLLRQGADGSFASETLHGVVVLAALELDGDPPNELLARLNEGGVAVLGWGATPLPTLPIGIPEGLSSGRAPDLEDGALARRWARAEELRGLGLLREAAAVLEDLAALAALPEDRARLTLRAAELWEYAGEDERASARFNEAAEHPDTAALGLAGAARAQLFHFRFEQARLSARRLLALPDLSAEARTEAEILEREALSGLGLDTVDALDPAMLHRWEIQSPLSVRAIPGERRARLDVWSNQREIARLPLRCDADRVGVSVEMDFQRHEWASGLEFALVRPDEQGRGTGVTAYAGGGGRVYQQRFSCVAPWLSAVESSGRLLPLDQRRSLRVELEIARDLGQAACRGSLATGAPLFDQHLSLPQGWSPGRHDLVIRHDGHSGVSDPTWARLVVRDLTITGCGAVESAPTSPLALAHGALARGAPAEALARLEGLDGVEHRLARLVALVELGREQEAIPLLRALADARAARPVLLQLSRGSEPFMAMARRVLGDEFYGLMAESWGSAIHHHPDDGLVAQTLLSWFEPVASWPGSALDRLEVEPMLLLTLARADAHVARGDVAIARRELVHAAGLAGDRLDASPVTDAIEGRYALSEVWIRLAGLALSRKDEAGALEAARNAVESAPSPLLAVDRLLLQPEIAALRERPGWVEILGAEP